MADLIYNETYGWLSKEQARLYKKHIVSTSDHDELVEFFGEDAREAICGAVRKYQHNGMFSVFEFWNRRPLRSV